jgi:hypothetical protein
VRPHHVRGRVDDPLAPHVAGSTLAVTFVAVGELIEWKPACLGHFSQSLALLLQADWPSVEGREVLPVAPWGRGHGNRPGTVRHKRAGRRRTGCERSPTGPSPLTPPVPRT